MNADQRQIAAARELGRRLATFSPNREDMALASVTILSQIHALEYQAARLELAAEFIELLRWRDHRPCVPPEGQAMDDWCTYCDLLQRWLAA